jgi:SagB-type dehydrogenase family enzyme
VGAFLRYSMGLSAWKAYQGTRWALRVNPSSGNLHPTEAYVVYDGRVCHYAPREHGLEERAILAPEAWRTFLDGHDGFLVALTSIHWREAWKYGERAFRYCQHDVGHAIGALRYAAALCGWTLRLLPRWSDAQIAGLLGVDRDEDRVGDAEHEEPECIAFVGAPSHWDGGHPDVLMAAAREASWIGKANRLSADHVEWPVIDGVMEATRYQGSGISDQRPRISRPPIPNPRSLLARHVILGRRSAVAFDARSTLPRARFCTMLSRLRPDTPPFDAIDWPPRVHLAIFVHRVEGLTPGIYVYLRDDSVLDEWRAATRPEFLWEPLSNDPNDPNGSNDPNDRLFLLLPTDLTWAANRVSCDQDIAGDGFFSLGMIARLGASLREHGESFYRRLFWECGLIGQVLYLEAEAAGARATGIGCFYDDAVHELLGLSGAEWQSLYHFSMGMPVDDARLTTEPGYAWEAPLSTR